MQQFPMAVKLSVMVAALVIPLLVVGFAQLQTLLGDYRVAELERQGAVIIDEVTDLLSAVQTHRTATMLAAKPEYAKLVPLDPAQTNAKIATIDALVKEHPGLKLGDAWQRQRTEVTSLLASSDSKDAMEVFRQHSKVVSGLRKLILLAGDSSALVLDPQAETYYLGIVMVDHAVPWLEAVSATRAVGAAWLTQSDDQSAHVAALGTLADVIDSRTEVIAEKFESLVRAGNGAVPKSAEQALAAAGAITKLARELDLLGRDPGPELALNFFERCGKALDTGRAFREEASHHLIDKLEQRKEQTFHQGLLLGGLSVTGMVLVLYLVLGFSVATVNSIKALYAALQQGAKGNLTTTVKVEGKDELAMISHEFENMLNVLSALVADVRSASSMVTHVGGQLVEDGQ
jgi:hypothetical protein